jgi:hypothetical protein
MIRGARTTFIDGLQGKVPEYRLHSLLTPGRFAGRRPCAIGRRPPTRRPLVPRQAACTAGGAPTPALTLPLCSACPYHCLPPLRPHAAHSPAPAAF